MESDSVWSTSCRSQPRYPLNSVGQQSISEFDTLPSVYNGFHASHKKCPTSLVWRGPSEPSVGHPAPLLEAAMNISHMFLVPPSLFDHCDETQASEIMRNSTLIILKFVSWLFRRIVNKLFTNSCGDTRPLAQAVSQHPHPCLVLIKSTPQAVFVEWTGGPLSHWHSYHSTRCVGKRMTSHSTAQWSIFMWFID